MNFVAHSRICQLLLPSLMGMLAVGGLSGCKQAQHRSPAQHYYYQDGNMVPAQPGAAEAYDPGYSLPTPALPKPAAPAQDGVTVPPPVAEPVVPRESSRKLHREGTEGLFSKLSSRFFRNGRATSTSRTGSGDGQALTSTVQIPLAVPGDASHQEELDSEELSQDEQGRTGSPVDVQPPFEVTGKIGQNDLADSPSVPRLTGIEIGEEALEESVGDVASAEPDSPNTVANGDLPESPTPELMAPALPAPIYAENSSPEYIPSPVAPQGSRLISPPGDVLPSSTPRKALDLTPEIESTSGISQSQTPRAPHRTSSSPLKNNDDARTTATGDPLPAMSDVRNSDLAVVRADERPLAIGRLALCEDVSGFEVFTEIPEAVVTPGQDVVIYTMLEGTAAVFTGSDYRTETISRLEICLPSGRVVREQKLGRAVDLAKSPRRDYFVTHNVRLPRELPTGDYVLRLTLGDVVARQTTTAQIPFTIRQGR